MSWDKAIVGPEALYDLRIFELGPSSLVVLTMTIVESWKCGDKECFQVLLGLTIQLIL